MQAIQRTFAILRLIAAKENALGVTQIAQQTQLPKGTVSRFLTALEEEGVIYRSESNQFSINENAKSLFGYSTFADRLVLRARHTLTQINQKTEEAIALSVLDGRTIKYLDHIASPQNVQVVDWTGRSVPLHVTSAGKLFLAFGNRQFVDQYLAAPLHPLTPHSITTSAHLLDSLVTIRKQDYAVTDEEFALGVVGYSVPVWNEQKTMIAALSLYGPKYRLDPNPSEAIIAMLKWHAKTIFEPEKQPAE